MFMTTWDDCLGCKGITEHFRFCVCSHLNAGTQHPKPIAFARAQGSHHTCLCWPRRHTGARYTWVRLLCGCLLDLRQGFVYVCECVAPEESGKGCEIPRSGVTGGWELDVGARISILVLVMEQQAFLTPKPSLLSMRTEFLKSTFVSTQNRFFKGDLVSYKNRL